MEFDFDLGVRRVRRVNVQAIKVNDDESDRVESLKCSGSVLRKRSGFEDGSMRRVKRGCTKWIFEVELKR